MSGKRSLPSIWASRGALFAAVAAGTLVLVAGGGGMVVPLAAERRTIDGQQESGGGSSSAPASPPDGVADDEVQRTEPGVGADPARGRRAMPPSATGDSPTPDLASDTRGAGVALSTLGERLGRSDAAPRRDDLRGCGPGVGSPGTPSTPATAPPATPSTPATPATATPPGDTGAPPPPGHGEGCGRPGPRRTPTTAEARSSSRSGRIPCGKPTDPPPGLVHPLAGHMSS